MNHLSPNLSALSRRLMGGLALAGLLAGSLTTARADTEPNNTFATREHLPGGTTLVSGTIGDAPVDFTVADFVFNDTLSPGSIITHTIPGLSVGQLFAAYVDNTVSGVDTVMRTLDENGDEIDFNDDFGSPLGDFLASGLAGTVNPDGTVRIEISGFPDDGFTGAHGESGPLDTYIKLLQGDVDYFSLSGLVPNSPFTAEIIAGNFDTVLGQFDDAGGLIDVDDDGGDGLLSLLTGTVSGNGVLNLAVSAFADFDFIGQHFEGGVNYRLNLTVQTVPEPGSVAMGIAAGLALIGLARRRRK